MSSPLAMNRRDFIKSAVSVLGGAELGAATARGMTVNTVLGRVPAARLGVTLMHEHVLVDFVGADKIAPGRYNVEEVSRVALPHLKKLKSLGCKTFVDCTPAYLGRDPALLARLAKASGLQIITNTGFYGAVGNKYLPRFAFDETAKQLAARWEREFLHGIPPSGIRPGFIKIGVDSGPLSDLHAKIVSAAALTHLSTGLTIMAHTGDGVAAMAQLDVLKQHGVPECPRRLSSGLTLKMNARRACIGARRKWAPGWNSMASRKMPWLATLNLSWR